jgi:hypothetical protein
MNIPFFKEKLDASKVFDTVANGLDKLAFTTEERSEFNMLLADKVAQYAHDTLNENTARSRTRRFIAIFIVINVLAAFWLCVVLALLKIDITIILQLISAFSLSTALIMVLAFFFGGYYVNKITDKNKTKE